MSASPLATPARLTPSFRVVFPATLLALVLAAAPFPEKLAHPTVARLERFQFPSADAFATAWAQGPTTGYRLVRATLTTKDQAATGWFLLLDGPERMRLAPVAIEGEKADQFEGWTVSETKRGSWRATRFGGEERGRLEVLEAPSSELSEVDLVPWTYVQTLVTPNSPLYAPDADDDDELTTLLFSLEGKSFSEWANRERRNDALYTRFASYRPMGRCSMDRTPQRAARAYAELAFARGDLAKFLLLQVNIMGDQFERLASSSYGEASHATEAERLSSTGIDVDQFLLGLVISRPDSRARLDPWRLARSLREADRVDALRPLLERLAQSPTTDAYNRLRAAEVLLYVDPAFGERAEDPSGWKPIASRRASAASALLNRLSLTPAAKAWLADRVTNR